MPIFFWYSTSHLTCPVAIRGTSGGIFVKCISQIGNVAEAVVPEDADVELAALDVLLGDRVGPDLLVDERHPVLQLLVVASPARLARCRASPPPSPT